MAELLSTNHRIEEALAKLKRNQERRLARKNAKENGTLYFKPGSMSKGDAASAHPGSGGSHVVSLSLSFV